MWIPITLAVLVELVPAEVRTAAVAFYFFVISNVGGNMPLLVDPVKQAFKNAGNTEIDALRGEIDAFRGAGGESDRRRGGVIRVRTAGGGVLNSPPEQHFQSSRGASRSHQTASIQSRPMMNGRPVTRSR